MNYKDKHKILQELQLKWKEGDEESSHGQIITDLGKSLTSIQLNKRTFINIDRIEDLCSAMILDNYLVRYSEDKNNKAHGYLITEQGKQVVTDRILLNKIVYRTLDFWFKMFTLVIATIGLLNSIFHFIESKKV
jgi:predicted transcriptional regulator